MAGLELRMNTAGLEKALADVEREMLEAARPAAQAAAQVLVDEVRKNVSSIGQKSGNLARAIYQAYSRDNSYEGKAQYHVSWNARIAPHGHLVEFGHWQPFVTYTGSDGKTYTAIRPSMRGKPKPRGRASLAEKSRYYVTLPAPRWVPAKPFVRPAVAKFDAAQAAATRAFLDALAEKGVVS